MQVPGRRTARALAADVRRRVRGRRPVAPDALPDRGRVPAGRVRLGIGPLNSAGQGWAWARAVERNLPDVGAWTWALETEGLTFPADHRVPVALYWAGGWQREHEEFVRTHLTHVLAESFRPYLGTAYGRTVEGDLPVLAGHGVAAALLCHGSDIRSPSRHRELEPFSPFRGELDGLTEKLEVSTGNHARIAAAALAGGVPVFVSTPDLLDYVEGASWLPVVVDLDEWTPGPEPLRAERPVVLHVPSNPLLKGSARIDQVLSDLDARGAITYRRADRVAPADMADLVRSVDVLVDQVGMSLYGVQAAQGMAAGRLVVAQVGDRLRSRLPEELPVLETDPDRLAATMEQVLEDRDAARALAAAGPGYAARVHDGRAAAAALAGFLGVPVPAGGPDGRAPGGR